MGGALSAGSIFGGDYRVVRLLGAGGMGEVYLVHQLSTGRERALKVMSAELAPNAEQRARFELEARVGAMIESDHVVEVIAAGFDEQTFAPFLVMELLDGETVEARCAREGALPRAEVARIFDQLGHALAAAHAKGIVHRDLKPANLFLARPRVRAPDAVLKVLDFGVAKLVGGAHASETRQVGTPTYMAPEQCRAEPVSTATDVWALGLIAFKLLTGKIYWNTVYRTDSSPLAIMYEIGCDPLEPASVRAEKLGFGGRLPSGFDGWFARCVARASGERFAEAGAATAALVALLRGDDADGGRAAETPRPPTLPRALPSGVARDPSLDASLPTLAPVVDPTAAPTAKDPASVVTPPPPPVPVPVPDRTLASPGTATPPAPATPNHPHSPYFPNAPASAPPRRRAGLVLGLAALAIALVAATAAGTALALRPPQRTALRPPAPFAIECPGDAALIPPGSFRRKGGGAKVAVAPFCMDRDEVSVAAYAECVKAGACRPPASTVSEGIYEDDDFAWRNLFCPGGRLGPGANQPVTCVDTRQARTFCEWRRRRLPSDVEFEWAARGGERATKHPWGVRVPEEGHLCSSLFEGRGWSRELGPLRSWRPEEGTAGSCELGSHPKGQNPWGVRDLLGNVWEMVASNQDGETVYETAGGGWHTGNEDWLHAAAFWTADWTVDSRDADTGFRCVAAPK